MKTVLRNKNINIKFMLNQKKLYRGHVVNLALSSLHERSLEITLTVPLIKEGLVHQFTFSLPKSTLCQFNGTK